MPSFDNLQALANYEERLKDARKIVWRDRGELPLEVQGFWECLEHAGRGGLREFVLTSSLLRLTQYRRWDSCVSYPFWDKLGSLAYQDQQSKKVSVRDCFIEFGR